MLRICLIGPGDVEYHFKEILKLPKSELNHHIELIAETLAVNGYELVLLPDRGVSFELAKFYKKFNGKKILGTVPLSDTDFGIEHLKPYMNYTYRNKKLFDGFIDTGTWYRQDLTHCIFGDVVLMLGNSLGSLGELVYGYYLYKLLQGHKPEVEVKKLHAEQRAGINVPFSVIVYKPFVKEHLNYEIEQYIEKHNGKVYYVNNALELLDVLTGLQKTLDI